jgi:tetratricopeptide (TPR) repeat protein
MEARMKLLTSLLFLLFLPSAYGQAEADLWRCSLPRLAPEDRVAVCTRAMDAAPEDAAPWHNRGVARLQLRQYKEAVMDFTAALRRDKSAQAHMFRGIAFSELGEYERALLDLEEAVRGGPRDAHAHNALAWVLATASVPGFRDGPRAVELALKACKLSGYGDPNHLDTLAAAYAEAGNFAEAVKWQEKALADPAFAADEHKEAKERLALYRARKPYRNIPR